MTRCPLSFTCDVGRPTGLRTTRIVRVVSGGVFSGWRGSASSVQSFGTQTQFLALNQALNTFLLISTNVSVSQIGKQCTE